MAQSSYLSAVNQKVLFATQLLAAVKTNNSHQTEALVQSVALQLYQAWHWHLCDVATIYKLADPQLVIDADALVAMLEAEGKCPAEAVEMQYLTADSNSWVSELFNAHAQLSRLPVIRRAEMDADRLPMIAVDAVSAEGLRNVEWTVLAAENWLGKLSELIDRQRDMMVEF